jgi:hypothetical protein
MKNNELKQKNIDFGVSKEIEFMNNIRINYPSIRANNKKDKYASMDCISDDNGEIIEHEHKYRNINHDDYVGLMFNRCKFYNSLEQIKNGIRQFYWWSCKDGIYYFELKDFEKQKHMLIFGENGNFQLGESKKKVIDVKTEYLIKFQPKKLETIKEKEEPKKIRKRRVKKKEIELDNFLIQTKKNTEDKSLFFMSFD